jgi:hypothetical protein
MADPMHDGIMSKPEYAPFILRALSGLGEASEDAVLDRVGELMRGALTEADRSPLYGGRVPRWRSQAAQMLDGLVEDGYVERRGGVLALSSKGRAAT